MQKAPTLEDTFRAHAKDLMSCADVKGVLCMDERGLPFYRDGTLTDSSAAVLSQLIFISQNINTNIGSPKPIVTLCSRDSKVIVAQNGSIVVAVHRSIISPNESQESTD